MNPRLETWLATLIVLAFVGITAIFSLGPIFEPPDEIEHYYYIRSLHHALRLPDPYSRAISEYHQPPLYYALQAPLLTFLKDNDLPQIEARRNPYHLVGQFDNWQTPGNDNKNLYLHRASEDFPYDSPTARTIHLLRLISLGLGTGTLIISYQIYRMLLAPHQRIMALACAAFTPMFAYLSGAINNDNLLILLVTLALYLTLKQQRDGLSWRRSLWLGLVLGAALITKLNALFMVFPVGLMTLLNWRQWRFSLITLLVTLVIAGGWFWSNYQRYGDFTAMNVYFETWEPVKAENTLADGWTRLQSVYNSYWATFGPNTVAVGSELHYFYNALTVLTAVGLVILLIGKTITPSNSPSPSSGGEFKHSLRQRGELERGRGVYRRFTGEGINPLVLIFLVFGVTWLGLVIYSSFSRLALFQGRFLLPGIVTWGAAMAVALDQFIPRRFKRPATLSFPPLLLTAALLCIFGYWQPTYRPTPLPETIEQPLGFQYEGIAELIGVRQSTYAMQPGNPVEITLYWRALQAPRSDLLVYVHSVGAETIRRDSYPATGNLLDWEPGQTWAETHMIYVPESVPDQVAYPLIAGLYDAEAGRTLNASDKDGNPIQPQIGRIAIQGRPQTDPDFSYRFGEVIGLQEPEIRDNEICFQWVSRQSVSVDYQVFVHVYAGGDQPVLQADHSPAYPTSAWLPGEVIAYCMPLAASDIPAEAVIHIGLYTLPDGVRLPACEVECGDHIELIQN